MEKKLKVLMLNGSPHGNGNTALAFREMEQVFRENDVEVENILADALPAEPAGKTENAFLMTS